MTENHTNRKHAAVFVDRDGTLIEDRHYLSDPSQVVLMDGCVDGLLQLSSRGFVLVMVTNQSGIARGLATQDQVDSVNRALIDLLSIHKVVLDGIYMCPHHPDEGCRCRKPGPGMVEQATEQLSIDIAQSWVIGDKCSDVLLGQNIGARTILIQSGNSSPEPTSKGCRATATTNSFREAAAYVCSQANPEDAGR